MENFSAPIIQQPRLLLVMPIVFVVVAVIAANVVWYLARSLGASQTAGGIAAAVVFVAGIVLLIFNSVGPQGTVRLEQGRLEVDARWRGPRYVPIAGADIRTMVWLRGGERISLIGVLLDIRGADGSSVTIGASDPRLANTLRQRGVESTTIPPRAALGPEHLRELMDALGVKVHVEGTS